VLIQRLIDAGATVKAYDPVAMAMARRQFPGTWYDQGVLMLVDHQYEAAVGADALVLVTEWKVFRNPDFDYLSKVMRQRVIFDGRNQYDPTKTREQGFEYMGIGR
jgi:UDPglucose 6-dehydrogenase